MACELALFIAVVESASCCFSFICLSLHSLGLIKRKLHALAAHGFLSFSFGSQDVVMMRWSRLRGHFDRFIKVPFAEPTATQAGVGITAWADRWLWT